jgi:carboxypeptidase T
MLGCKRWPTDMPAGYLTTDGIEGVVAHLAATYSGLTELIALPETSVEGRRIRGLKIAGGTNTNRRGVLFLGGVHARELINPDLLVTFATRLLQAYTAGAGLAFGPVTYTSGLVKLIVEQLDLFIVPLVNPDGRTFVQNPAGDAMWRKNRNPNVGQPCKGVDLNRNYDFLWSSGIGTSASACSDTFKGAGAFSEPETRNIRWLLDTRSNIMCMADVHSYSELVLYPWGDDDNQSANASMNFMNPAFNGQRGVANSGYQEYIPATDASWFASAGKAVRDAIAGVRGREYTAQQGIKLYPTSATVHDYAYSRHFTQATHRKVMAFTIETAREFQPPWSEAEQVILEASAGLMALLEQALCAAESLLSSTAAASQLTQLRLLRDTVLASSPAGRLFTSLFEQHGAELLRHAAYGTFSVEEAVKVVQVWAASSEKAGGLSKAPVSASVVDSAKAMMVRLQPKASTELQRSMTLILRDLDLFRDRPVAEALAVITKKRRLK